MPDSPATVALDGPLVAAAGTLPALPERYRDLGLIGSGGMGEVRRVWDRLLRRSLAMKLLRWDARDQADARARFLTEARVTAGLQHPGIVAVHDHGLLEDGRPWLTMREIRGRTFAELLGAPSPGGDALGRVRDRMAWFGEACDAVAFAHSRGVVHRDLKPSNLMVDELGAVVVLDWGIARTLADAEEPVPAGESAELEPHEPATQVGRVLGSPGYVPPEGYQGAAPDPRADVWALGRVLVELLLGCPASGPPLETGLAALQREAPGAAPVSPHSPAETLRPNPDILDSPPAAPGAPRRLPGFALGFPGTRGALPDALLSLAAAALAEDPSARPAHAGELANAVRGWLEEVRHLDRAEAMVREAEALAPAIVAHREAAAALREEGAAALAALAAHAPEAEKRPAWALEDAAEARTLAAVALEINWERLLGSALKLVPHHTRARGLLSDHYRDASDRARQEDQALRLQEEVRVLDPVRHAAWLRGDATLSLHTEPADATVEVHRYVREGRRLVARAQGATLRAPLRAHVLPAGSYLLVIRAPGYATLRFPVLLDRGGAWEQRPPGHADLVPVRLLPQARLDPGEVHIAAGWFTAGGDPEAADAMPRTRVWLDDFVIARHPVTCAEYLTFLDALATEDAARWAPREAGQGEGDRPLVTRGPDGRHMLVPGSDGGVWAPDWPITMVSWYAAQAYAGWASTRRGVPLRLPTELEWEKAARGVDGRQFPWGDHADATWARMVTSLADRTGRAAISEHPVDEGPAGVRGLGGNVRDWCADAYLRGGPPVMDGRPHPLAEGTHRIIRGGCWASPPRMCRAAARFADRPETRLSVVGFRLARSV